MSQKRKPRAGTWHLRSESFEVKTKGGLEAFIDFHHESDMSTEAVVTVRGTLPVYGKVQLSKSDTYSRSAGRILSLTRALGAAGLTRAERSEVWALMPDVRARKTPRSSGGR